MLVNPFLITDASKMVKRYEARSSMMEVPVQRSEVWFNTIKDPFLQEEGQRQETDEPAHHAEEGPILMSRDTSSTSLG